MAETFLGRLKKLFSTDVVIRNVGGDQLKVMDTDNIQSLGVLQTNSVYDRYARLYTTSGGYNYNLSQQLNYPTTRIQLYADYEAMDTDAICASALDIVADECTLRNENGEVLQIRSSDETIQRILYNLFYDVLNIEFNLWSWTRNMCKYGDFYLKLEISEKFGVYGVIPFSAYNILREEGYDLKKPQQVRFKYDPSSQATSPLGYVLSAPLMTDPDGKGVYFDNYEMAHFRLLSDFNYLPYGRSYLEPGRKLYKQLVLMEDAMLIHRIVRAPEKRVFYVNVGNIPPNEVEGYMQKMINKMKKTPVVDPQTGQYNLRYNMQNVLEDFYIPVRGGDQTTKIDTTKGLEYAAIEDVTYLRDKLFSALKIPKAYLGYEGELSGKATLAAEDIRFARTIERIQRILISELTKIALVHLYSQGYDNEQLTNFDLSLTTPSIIYDQERIELLKSKIELAGSIMENNLMPTDWIYNNLLHLSEDQVSEIRDLLAEDKKREFRFEQIKAEGNDPVESGQAYGTPHQLASLYGKGRQTSRTDVPKGYSETDSDYPEQPIPGRPEKGVDHYDQDSNFGRDRLGTQDLKGKGKDGDGMDKYNAKTRANINTSMKLEAANTQAVYLQNKTMFDNIKSSRKVNLFEQSNLLDEDNIREEIK
jgi:hypothetical protein